jgi:hypothetical protein
MCQLSPKKPNAMQPVENNTILPKRCRGAVSSLPRREPKIMSPIGRPWWKGKVEMCARLEALEQSAVQNLAAGTAHPIGHVACKARLTSLIIRSSDFGPLVVPPRVFHNKLEKYIRVKSLDYF